MGDCPQGEWREPEQPIVKLDLRTLLDSGLLWKINHDLLHPLGLALAASSLAGIPDDEGALLLDVRVALDAVWQFAPGLTRQAEWDAWYAEQRAKMVDAPPGRWCQSVHVLPATGADPRATLICTCGWSAQTIMPRDMTLDDWPALLAKLGHP